jgi:tRNA(Ile)-lysidine synthase
METAAREVRYAAFVEAAARLSATVVATAHTLDDQAETVLLRLLRGTSSRGVSAIRPKRGPYARPLLGERRASILAYLAERGQAYREDSSNADTAIPRNRIRHRLVPVVDEIWPGGVASLARFARLAADDEASLGRAAAAAGQTVRSGAGGVELDRSELRRLDRAISRRVIRGAIEDAAGQPSAATVEAVLRLATSDKKSGHLDLQQITVDLTSVVVAIRPAGHERASLSTGFSYVLAVPGRTDIDEAGCAVEASISSEAGEQRELRSAGPVAALQFDQVDLPLTVRSRRIGDRIKPLGAPGTRRIQDLLVDRKVPAAERDRVPIVEDHSGRIVWVAGVAIAERVRVTRPEAGVVILKLRT